MCFSQGCCKSLEAAREGGNRFRLHRSAGVKNYNIAVILRVGDYSALYDLSNEVIP